MDHHKFCDIDIDSAVSKIKDAHGNQTSIIEIKKVTKNKTAFSFNEVEEVEILKLLKNIDVKKSTEEKRIFQTMQNALQ